MRTGNDRVQVVGEQVCVTIGAAVVEPGDILRGDSDGVIVISKDREEETLVCAEGIDKAEQEIRPNLKLVRDWMPPGKNQDITVCKRRTVIRITKMQA